MSRERMITRTIVTREVRFKKYNLETAQITEDMVVFGVNVNLGEGMEVVAKVNAKLAAMGQKATCIMVESVTDNETLYGMTEEDFLRLAKVLPPRTATVED